MKESLQNALSKLKNGWKTHKREIILFLGVLVVGIIGFELGLMEGQSKISKPLVIEVPGSPSISEKMSTVSATDEDKQSSKVDTVSSNQPASGTTCAFVGSKNSNKYHLPTCSFAKRIKPENRVCFVSAEDAKSKGYVAGCVK
jgi:hypothetical protein